MRVSSDESDANYFIVCVLSYMTKTLMILYNTKYMLYT